MKRALLVLLLAASTTLSAQTPLSWHTVKLDDPAKRPPAKLADLDWLTGHWVGTGFGARAEEIWTAVDGQSLVGLFRLVKDGRAQVYEIITVVADGDSLDMRLKHFNSTLKGWEEKDAFVSFPLVKLEGRTAWFDGMTYQLEADGTLRVWLMQGAKEGPPQEVEIVYRRQP